MKNTTKEIKNYLDSIDINNLEKEIKSFNKDSRVGVKKILAKYQKKYDDFVKEKNRINILSSFETNYYSQGFKYIAGIDEVGRGPLAGPVVVAAVILPENAFLYGVNDSKKLSAKKREALYVEIEKIALDISIGIVGWETIDKINILQATYEAMRTAVKNLKIKPDILLNDAVYIPDVDIFQHPIIYGDKKSISIASASIIAKVTRDKIMTDFAKKYPQYDFENNKGYGTEKHINAIEQFGLTPIHRRSFVSDLIKFYNL